MSREAWLLIAAFCAGAAVASGVAALGFLKIYQLLQGIK